jgi:hypothetical protein
MFWAWRGLEHLRIARIAILGPTLTGYLHHIVRTHCIFGLGAWIPFLFIEKRGVLAVLSYSNYT